ncbi:MAG: hypothetical protein HZA50_03340 [Planctomycetes bacterium]|nr:hypothetical protein [Planctomycetota bacterium]
MSNRDQADRAARLTLARSYRDGDLIEKAAETYSRIITDWPATIEAKQAKDELDKMRDAKKLVLVEAKN